MRPQDFYAENYLAYRDLARAVALQVLTNLRPGDADPAIWAGQAQVLANQVVAYLVTEEEVGIMIALDQEAASGQPAAATDSRNYQLSGLTVAQVERFVAAGRQKESADEPGKNLDERDDGKTDLQIAWRIMYALRLQKPGAVGLEAAVQRFLAAEKRGDAQGLLPEVLKAWLAVFAPRVLGDWRRFVHRVIGTLGA